MDLLGSLGTGTNIFGQLLEGFGQLQKSKDQSLVEQLNAAVARANASAIQTAGEFDTRSLEKQKKRFGGLQHAGYAKAGVRSEGSPIDVMIDSAAQFETDILISKYNTKVGEIQANLTSKLYDAESKKAKAQGLGAMGSTLLSVGSSLFGLSKSKSGYKLPVKEGLMG